MQGPVCDLQEQRGAATGQRRRCCRARGCGSERRKITAAVVDWRYARVIEDRRCWVCTAVIDESEMGAEEENGPNGRGAAAVVMVDL
ncbi:hypothetical protein M0R45_020315 [Rubus argutus]|uniref:Uncharacterized protein n=1 Tax=Rubus argutus TaxID=59490 RepID=A0AAW1X802_RUBAR